MNDSEIFKKAIYPWMNLPQLSGITTCEVVGKGVPGCSTYSCLQSVLVLLTNYQIEHEVHVPRHISCHLY